MPSAVTIIASVTMKGCSRPPTISMPLIAPKHRPTQGATISTPSTPNFVAVCGSEKPKQQRGEARPRGKRNQTGRASGRARYRGRPSARLPALFDVGEDEAHDRKADDQRHQAGHRQAHIGCRRLARDGEQHRRDHRADRHQRADRQVDAAGDDDGRHAGGDQAGDRDLPQHVEQIAVGQEDVVALGAHRRGEHAEQEDRDQPPIELGARDQPQALAHAAALAGDWRRGELHDALLARLGARQHARCRPSDMTRMRSDSSSSSGNLGADDDDRQAFLARQLEDQVVDLALGADIDAARRLVEQQHARPCGQPFADDDLLLIAARQRARRLLDAAAANAERLHRVARQAQPRRRRSGGRSAPAATQAAARRCR